MQSNGCRDKIKSEAFEKLLESEVMNSSADPLLGDINKYPLAVIY
jgi:predicted ATP-binding protein involved in virulence